ncbi:MAG: universal stress protein [Desulfobulbaceae bacterium]|nr:universal stress protein [Desulfobulbaceae bacterium]HIJ89679.1 universal stress protein [Deltaproteobacteria bacterium]
MTDIKKILVPTDFSEHSNKVLQSASMIARKFGASIEVVFVVESLDAYAGFAVPHLPLENLEKDLIERAKRKMKDFIEANMEKDIPHASAVLNGNIPKEIVRHAKAEGCDLIMIGTQTCKGVEKTLFGSVTERVIKTADCPVLSMNPCM